MMGKFRFKSKLFPTNPKYAPVSNLGRFLRAPGLTVLEVYNLMGTIFQK